MAYNSNKSIYEQVGSMYAQGAGILLRDNEESSKKKIRNNILMSVLGSALGAFKNQLTDNVATKINDLTSKNAWDTNYETELWKQGQNIRDVNREYENNPSYFRGIAKESIKASSFGIKIEQAGGPANFNKTESKIYQELIDYREKELVDNHLLRMSNPTAKLETYKQFTDGTRDMFANQLKNIKDDPANKNLFFGVLRKFGVGKDKEVELQFETQKALEAQTKRWQAAEAFIAPLKVTKFIDYNIENDAQAFTLGRTINSTKRDAEISKLVLNLQSPGDKSTFDDIKFTALSENEAGRLGGKSNGIAIWTNGNETGAELLALRTKSGSPFTEDSLKNMEVYYNKGKKGDVQLWDKTKKIENASTYIAEDVYTLSQLLAESRPELSEERRHSIAIQTLVENGNIRKTDNMVLSDNYIYVPLNRSNSPEDSLNADEDNLAAKLEAIKAAEREQLLKDTPNLLNMINPYLDRREDLANESGDVEELTIFQALNMGDVKVTEKEKLKFIFNPPKELVGTSVVLEINGVPDIIKLGTGNKDIYQNLYNFYEEAYGEDATIKSLLNETATDKKPPMKFPSPVIQTPTTLPLSDDDILSDPKYAAIRDEMNTEAGISFRKLQERPVQTITDIDEVLEKIDTVDSVKDLKNFKSKITRGIRELYKEDTGDNKILNLNDLSLEEYRKYLTMYRAQFIDDNQDLFNESTPKSLLAGN